MKKHLILVTTFILSGCSMWQNWSWNSLNPWSDNQNTDVVAESQPEPEKETEVLLPENVNKYLWQASLDRLAVMGISAQTPEEGRIVTDWKVLPSAPKERFKIVAQVDGGELRADALDIKVYKELKNSNGQWVKVAPTAGFETQVGQAIITKAKVLYINDQDRD